MTGVQTCALPIYRLPGAEVLATLERGDDVYAMVRLDGDADFAGSLVLFTSGSSGERKPVRIAYDSVLACSAFMNEAMGVTADDAEAIYAQLDHAFAIGRVVSCALAGARFEVLGSTGRMTPASVQRILDVEGLSGLACMPSLLLRMVSIDQLREQLAGRLRYAQVGAMYLPPQRKLELVERLPDTRIFAHYGMTEYMRATFYDLSAHPDKAHTEGRASGATEIRIEPRDSLRRRSPRMLGHTCLRWVILSLGCFRSRPPPHGRRSGPKT